MSRNLRWRIYYGIWDGATEEYRYWQFSGRTFGDVLKAPADGVQVIIQENEAKAGKKRDYDILWGKDYYIWRPDQGWIAVDWAGFGTYMREVGFAKYVIFGYSMTNEAFRECHARALRDGLGD